MLRLFFTLFILFSASTALADAPDPHNALDCLFCHDDLPRFGVDTRETIGFYRFEGDDPSLCFVCHGEEENLHPIEVAPGADTLSTQVPGNLPLGSSAGFEGKVVCTTCHFIHAADADHALLRGFAGSQQPQLFARVQELCRQCHGKGLEGRSPHKGDERACSFCHTAVPEVARKASLVARGKALCNFCHGALQEDHTRGLLAVEGIVDCMSCHDPHLDAEHPGRLKPEYFDLLRGSVTVDPHNRRTLCSLCHVEEKKFTLMMRDAEALCNRCHRSRRIVGSSHPSGPVPQGMTLPEGWPVREGRLTCLTCHLVGHPEDRGGEMLLRGGPYGTRTDFCPQCHGSGEGREPDPHRMVQELKGCARCHSATPVFGKDTSRTVALKASVNLVCLRCHDDSPHPGGIEHPETVSEKRAAGIPEYLPLGEYRRINCATCHNPHLPGDDGYKLRESKNGMRICTACHRV